MSLLNICAIIAINLSAGFYVGTVITRNRYFWKLHALEIENKRLETDTLILGAKLCRAIDNGFIDSANPPKEEPTARDTKGEER